MQKLLLLILPILLFASVQKVSVQLEWKHQFEFAGFYAAIEQGYYKDIGLEVELKEYHEKINISDDVIAQKSEFGVSSSSLILDKLNNKPVVLIASYFKQNALVLATNPSIKNIKELKNKTIMALPYEIEHTSLGAMLKDNNINKDDYTLIKHDFNAKKFINGEVDAVSIFLTNQTFLLDKANIKYNILNPSDYGIYSYDLELFTSQKFAHTHPKLVKEFAEATNKGWEYALKHKKDIVELIYNKYSKKKSKDALLYEAIKTEKLFKTHIFKIGSIVQELIELNVKIYNKLGVIDKKIDIKKLLKNYTLNDNLKEKNIQTIQNFETTLQLTQEEQEYLKNNTITMCIDPNWMPFEKLQNNKYIGISADYFKLIKKNLNTDIKIIPTNSWPQSLEFAKRRKCDILSLLMKTPKRAKYLNFTSPYLSIPMVLATKPNVAFISDIEKLEDVKIGVTDGYSFNEILRLKYPKLNIVNVDSLKDGLQKVSDGKIFGYIGTSASIGYAFQQEFTGELKIAGKFGDNWDMGIGVRNDDPVLLNIMQKAIKGIDENSRKKIFNKWIAIKYEKGIDTELIKQIILIAFILLFIVIYWNRKLSFINKELSNAKNKANELAKEKASFLANMSHEIRTPMNAIVGMSYLIKETKLSKIQYEYVQKIEISSNNLLKLINDILDFSKIEARRLKIKKVDFNLLEILNDVENMLKIKTYEKGLEFNILYDKSNSIYLHGDSLRLSQVLTNLVSNAIKFTEKGKVELIVKKVTHSKFRFEITDTGIGLTKEQLTEIFSSFTQADNSITRKYGGTGLGLAISKELVELMGGKIWVESVFGKGSKFIFEIYLIHSKNDLSKKTLNLNKTYIPKTDKSNKPSLSKIETKKLFVKLLEATKKRRPQLCEPILEELNKYTLDEQDTTLFINVKNLIQRYKFDDARKLLDEE